MKRGIVTALIAILSFSLIGCGDAMPELTDEQDDLIAEYSAMLLLKHSNNYNYRIADEEDVAMSIFEDKQNMKAAVEEAQGDDGSKDSPDAKGDDKEDNKTGEKETVTVDTGEGRENSDEEASTDGETPDEGADTDTALDTETAEEEPEDDTLYAEDVDFASLLGIGDTYELTFESLETADIYPSSSFSASGFQISASKGKQLIVLHFKLKNISGAKVHCDMMDINPNIKLSVNGKDFKSIDNTLLVNDITTYISDMAAGETMNLVGIMETSSGDIESVELLLSTKNEKTTMVVY